jgi:acyl-CoA dehydrogenase
MLGPALLKFGTEDQKLEHLPKIARGEIRWAQGYSEPNAGSDLASVRTKCEDKGDHYLVNGQKTWTSYGDKCDWIFALVRTDAGVPKHQGISFILIDMDQPGVETRPIKLISGTSHFTETFFDNVKVPKDQLVGEPGQGWSVTKYLLNHEREMIGSSQMSGMGTATLSSIARDTLGKDGIAASGRLRSEIIDAEIDGWLLAIALEKLRDESKAGTVSPFVGSTLKIAGTEIAKRRAELWMTLTGLRGMTAGSAPAFDWLFSPATTIAGGSNEIQLNILAKRALELPGG